MRRTRSVALGLAAVAGVAMAFIGYANEMRPFTPIPSAADARRNAPEGAELPEKFERVARGEVEQATRELSDAWTDQDLSSKLGDTFFDGQRLDQNMDVRVPHDATMAVESVRAIHTQNQYIMRDEDGGRVRVSTVTATVSTRTTANDPATGTFVRLPGVNRLTFEVKEKLD